MFMLVRGKYTKIQFVCRNENLAAYGDKTHICDHPDQSRMICTLKLRLKRMSDICYTAGYLNFMRNCRTACECVCFTGDAQEENDKFISLTSWLKVQEESYGLSLSALK